MASQIAKSWRKPFGFAVLALMLFVLAYAGHTVAVAQQLVPLKIVTARGEVHQFRVELADNDETRQKGLMFRKSMPSDQGMLFDFQVSVPVSMWMKNTYIPLDMLFIRADGTVARIAENTEPLSTRVIPSGEPVLSVLELAGGTSARLGIKAGDRVEHPLFRK